MIESVSIAEGRGIEVWVFGSACSSDTPRDIDLLVIYDEPDISVEAAIDIKTRLREALGAITVIPADIRLLNRREAAQTSFLTRVAAERLR